MRHLVESSLTAHSVFNLVMQNYVMIMSHVNWTIRIFNHKSHSQGIACLSLYIHTFKFKTISKVGEKVQVEKIISN